MGSGAGNYPVLSTSGIFNGVTIYYTETVKSEYNALLGGQLPTNFRYIDSALTDTHKGNAYRHLISSWNIPGPLTLKQQMKFRNDMYIIFEASASMFSKNSMWIPSMGPSPILLTNNLSLYHKFLNSYPKEEIVEIIVNAHGMEHVIEVITLDRLQANGSITD